MKLILLLKGEPIELATPVRIGKNVHIKPQGPKYALLADILGAKTLDEVFKK
jgi:hypothetical protein